MKFIMSCDRYYQRSSTANTVLYPKIFFILNVISSSVNKSLCYNTALEV